MKSIITRTVWVLSFVSLFTDTASEMLYPIMPMYLKSIGFSIVLIGILEGVAEATAGLSKGYFGKWSDVSGKRVPFVRMGYLLSAISKPMMALMVYPLWMLFARTTDRLGKGVRTAARDAMLSDEATPATKARVFGLHRSMDTLGAVLGPALALLYLYYFPQQYTTLFFIAFVPGHLAVLSTLFLNDNASMVPQKSINKPGLFTFLTYWSTSPAPYRRLVFGLLVFALFNSSDIFLLLRIKEAGLDDTSVIGVYIFYNLVYAIFGYPAGVLADRLGMKGTFMVGLVIFAVVYGGMAFATSLPDFVCLFLLYGVYAASTESIAKAWITNLSDKRDTAVAVGMYSGFQSICTMLASTLAGMVWFAFGAQVAFLLSAAITVAVVIYFAMAIEAPQRIQ